MVRIRLSKSGHCEDELLWCWDKWRCSEWISEPFLEVSVREEVETKQRSQIRERPGGPRKVVKPLEKHECQEGCPNLNPKSVFGGTDEGLDLQILFERLEKDLDLPPVLIDRGDGGGTKIQVVGEQDNRSVVVTIPHHDSPQRVWAFPRRPSAGEQDDLIGEDISILRYATSFNDLVDRIAPHPSDKVDSSLGPLRVELVVVECSVKGDDRSGVETKRRDDFRFVELGLGDRREPRHVVVMIEQYMDLDAAF